MRAFLLITVIVFAAIGLGVAIEATTSSPHHVKATAPSPPPHQSNLWTISTRQPALRIDVRQSCPKSVAQYHDVTNANADARTTLVPPNPTAGLICRYGTIPTLSSSIPYTLVVAKRLGQQDASALAEAIDRVSTKRPTGLSSCPAQFATATIIAFAYANGSNADIWYEDSGCQMLDNGFLASSELGDPAFYNGFMSLIERLAPRG